MLFSLVPKSHQFNCMPQHTLEKARVGQPEVKKKKYEALHEQVVHKQGCQEEQDKLRFLRLICNNLFL